MTTDEASLDMAAIREAFIEPIRTVMLIDDRFPTLGSAVTAAAGDGPVDDVEWLRAGRLWAGCRSRRWLCDVECESGWDADRIACIAGSDLIILDYHLDGGEDTPADASRGLLRHLARHNHTNLVVVYTSRDDLSIIRDEIMAGLRGRRDWRAFVKSRGIEFEEAFSAFKAAADRDGAFDRPAFEALCRGDVPNSNMLAQLIQKTRADLVANDDAWDWDWRPELLVALGDHRLEELQAPVVPMDDVPEVVRAGERWIECGNVFVTLMTKPKDPPADEDEAEALVRQLEAALVEWRPSGMRAAVALARAEVRRAGIRGDALSLRSRSPTLEAGWWYSMLSAEDAADQTGRARQIAVDLLAGVGEVVADRVGAFIATATPEPAKDHASAMAQAQKLAGITAGDGFEVGHALNAFLSCGRLRPTKVGCGTIFAVDEPDQKTPSYFVSVSPACDMEPRRPSGSYHWLRALHP